MTTDDTTAMVDPVQILAQHADFVANGARHCTCGLWSDDTDDAQYTRVPFVHHTLAQLALYGYAVDTDSVPQLKAELEHLRALQRDDRATAIAAIAERDAALASYADVTRVDIIGDTVHEFWADEWSVRFMDEGRTLKLFADGDGAEAKAVRDKALVADLKAAVERLREGGDQ